MHSDQAYYKLRYSLWIRTTHKPSKVPIGKNFFPSAYVTVTACFDKCFLFHPITGRHCFFFKGCVRYIFASLFFMSKREHLWNKEECFLFHLESSFRSWDNQTLNFQIFKCHDVIKFQAWNTKHILLNNLGSKHSLVMKFGQFM